VIVFATKFRNEVCSEDSSVVLFVLSSGVTLLLAFYGTLGLL
jgi:hypothetical protein